MSFGALSPDDLGRAPNILDPAALAAVRRPPALAMGPAAVGRGLLAELVRSLRAHALFIAVVLVHLAAALVLPPLLHAPVRYQPSLYGGTFIEMNGIALVAFALAYPTWVMIAVRPAQLVRYMWNDLTVRVLTVERLCTALPVWVLFPVFAATFTYFKMMIPAFHPFDWDPQFAAWDRALHGGHDPWTLLQPLLGHPYVTAGINAGYHLWFGVTYGVVLWQMVAVTRPRLRMRYLLTFLLIWIIVGNLAATLLSSAGPVYYGRITGLPDPFAPLMAYLHAADAVASVPALAVQDMLWGLYAHSSLGLGSGISAMPSMHLATAFSFALLGFAIHRRLGIVFGLFALLILVGSVHLGWHYAIDGYAGMAGTWLIWTAVGWLLRRPSVGWLLWGDGRTAGDETGGR